jgi:tetratricopeptide (TPR) repeat protein
MLVPLLRATGLLLLCCVVFTGAVHADDASEINRLFSAGQASEAFARLDRLLAAKPRDPQLRFQKGVMLAEAQRRTEAADIFNQLIVDYPEMPEPYNNLAVIYAGQGDFDRARASLEAAVRAQPGYAVAHQNLGDTYAQMARLSYAQALKLDPSNAAIPHKLALLRELVKPVSSASASASASAPTPAPK